MTVEHNQETEALLRLLRSALHQTDTPLEWIEECNVSVLAGMIENQCLVPMLYPVIQKQNGSAWKELAQRLKPIYDRELHRGLVQEYEIQSLLDDMEQDGIDCLPLKGWVMRNYYPEPLMRSMADLDVLIRDMDSLKMKKWMQAHGYTPEHIEQSVHDTYTKPPYMNIELHRRLMEETRLKRQHTSWRENRLVSLWKYRLKGKEHIYCLSDEDFLVHHILHFYKHFTGSGVGIRPLVDLYLYLQSKQQILDWEYLKKQLDALHIFTFCKKMVSLSYQCFEEEKKLDESEQLIVGYLTQTGVYGDLATTETAYLFQEAERNVKRARVHVFLRRCFPSVATMKNIYPRLRHIAWALPFYWMLRVSRIIFRESYKLSAIKKYQTQDRYDWLKQIYFAAGVIENDNRR